MFLIECPYCGVRDQSEFTARGEAHIARPADPDLLDDQAYADYVFVRDNPRGWVRERWVHHVGCGQWFNVLRHSVSEEIVASYRPTDPKPPLPEDSRP